VKITNNPGFDNDNARRGDRPRSPANAWIALYVEIKRNIVIPARATGGPIAPTKPYIHFTDKPQFIVVIDDKKPHIRHTAKPQLTRPQNITIPPRADIILYCNDIRRHYNITGR
ncbi:MAG: hypothetical protein FWB85_09455, partial [Chitinispirillia bacterium]|nr:hypothetical protein [Chitinispirillia bacterium]